MIGPLCSDPLFHTCDKTKHTGTAKMRSLLAVLCIVCLITQIKSKGKADHDEAVEKTCKAKHNVDESIFIDGKSGYEQDVIILKDESNENHRCYVECLMEGNGFIKDGELDQEFVMQEVLEGLAEKSVNADNEKLKESIKKCAEKTGDEKCDRVYQIAKCLVNVAE